MARNSLLVDQPPIHACELRLESRVGVTVHGVLQCGGASIVGKGPEVAAHGA